MTTKPIDFTLTLEALYRHLVRFATNHPEILDEGELIRRAVTDRWGAGLDPRISLEQAAIRSLRQDRQRAHRKGAPTYSVFFAGPAMLADVVLEGRATLAATAQPGGELED
jgi:hypothetical protein